MRRWSPQPPPRRRRPRRCPRRPGWTSRPAGRARDPDPARRASGPGSLPGRAIDRVHHRDHLCLAAVLAEADTPEHAVTDLDLEVGGGLGVAAGGEGVLAV